MAAMAHGSFRPPFDADPRPRHQWHRRRLQLFVDACPYPSIPHHYATRRVQEPVPRRRQCDIAERWT